MGGAGVLLGKAGPPITVMDGEAAGGGFVRAAGGWVGVMLVDAA